MPDRIARVIRHLGERLYRILTWRLEHRIGHLLHKFLVSSKHLSGKSYVNFSKPSTGSTSARGTSYTTSTQLQLQAVANSLPSNSVPISAQKIQQQQQQKGLIASLPQNQPLSNIPQLQVSFYLYLFVWFFRKNVKNQLEYVCVYKNLLEEWFGFSRTKRAFNKGRWRRKHGIVGWQKLECCLAYYRRLFGYKHWPHIEWNR